MSSWDLVNDDQVVLKLADQEIAIATGYEIRCSVFDQPAAFTLRCGWSKTIVEMLRRWGPGIPFTLGVRTVDLKLLTQVMSGRVDAVSTGGSAGSELQLSGRDDMARLFDAFVEADETFHESSYYDLTRRVMDKFGLKDRKLVVSNLANRKAITGKTTITELRKPRNCSEMQVEETTGGTKRVVYRKITAKLGERWYDFLKRQYKRPGLFLWAAADGSFVLSEPNPNQLPLAKIVRRPPNAGGYLTVSETAADRARFRFDTTERNSKVTVWGRCVGGRCEKRTQYKGEHIDQEMVGLGFDKPATIHDDDVKSNKDAEFVARRYMAEQARAGWTLEYLLSGHSAPAMSGSGRVIWAVDTMAEVDDQEIGLSDRYYLSDLTFSKAPQATTLVRLARREDLMYAEEIVA